MGENRRTVFDCPVEFTLDILGGKWKVVLLAHLKDGPLAYGELRRRVTSLSDKMLSQRLKNLEAGGLVARRIDDDSSGRVRYCLTERGESLRPLLQTLFDWGVAASTDTDVVFRSR